MQDLLKIRRRLDEALRGEPVQLYFAFGTLLSKERICGITENENIIRVSPASLHNFKLVFRGVADIIQQENFHVNGAIYAITKKDEISLDRYESYPSFYNKGYLDFNSFMFDQSSLSNLNLVSQKIMFYQIQNSSEFYPPSESTIKTIETGYREWKLDLSTLQYAIKESENYQTQEEPEEFDFHDDERIQPIQPLHFFKSV